MLKCRDIAVLASEYHDGRLSESRELAFKEHLARCEPCRRFQNALADAPHLVCSQDQRSAVPEETGMIDRIKKRVSGEVRRVSAAESVIPSKSASNEPVLEGVQQSDNEKVAHVFDDILQTEGFVANIFRAFAHQPEVLEQNWAREKALMHGGILSSKLKSAIVVVVSADNGCPYCVHHHRAALMEEGLTLEGVNRVEQQPESAPLPEKEIALLLLARQANLNPRKAGLLFVGKARDCGATDAEIVEAMSVMELYSSWNKFIAMMNVQIESDVG
ncbi:MAG: carboxymuconolactone decarboxylase family protein [Marinobacter sp.]